MKAGSALTILFLLCVYTHVKAQPSRLPQFISCLVHYQSQTETQRIAKALATEEEIAAKFRPEVSSKIANHDDLINGKKNPNNPQWSVSLNQTIFSYSDSKENDAQAQIVKSETELTKLDVLQGTERLIDLLMSSISSRGRVQILKDQIESQRKTFNILKEMVKARILDGSQMLMAESDLAQSQIELKDAELELENLEKNLKIIPFYQSMKLQSLQQIENFFANSDTEPLKIEQRPEIKALEYSLKANQNLYKMESRSWIPKLDASVTYAQALDNPEGLAYRNQMIGSLTLTIPLSDSIYNSNRASLYKSEINRIEVLSDRTKSSLNVSLEIQKKTLAIAKDQLLVVSEAISSLKKAKEILQRKLQLNKTNYIEFSGLEDRINQMNTVELEKKISIWKMMALWESEKRVVLKIDNVNDCQILAR